MSKEYFINKVLATTVVGSYPVVKGGGLRSFFDPLHSAVETVCLRSDLSRYRYYIGRAGAWRHDRGIYLKTSRG